MRRVHLTTPQQNIWNLQKYYADTAISNLCGAIFYKEKRNTKQLQQAVTVFIEKQSGMRLRFTDGTVPTQYVSEEKIEEIPFMTFDTMDELDSYAKRFAKEPIGLCDTAMYRFVIFQVENQSGVLVVLSHLISDAWTFGLMANQVDVLYHMLEAEQDITSVEMDYLDYVQSEEEYFSSERYLKDQAYWESKYENQPERTVVKISPATSGSIAAKRITKVLPAVLEQKIDEFCRQHPVTQAVLFETALMIYLSKINPENSAVTIGVPVLNRSNAKERKIAGMFVSTMPLTLVINETETVGELSAKITKEHMNIFRHQKYPYSSILQSLREKQNFQGNLYDVMISYQNAQTDTGADTKWYSNGASEVPFVIHIDNRDSHECHTINVDYQSEVFGQETEVRYIIERLEYIIEQIVENYDKTIKDIHMIPEKEWNQLVYDFNDTYVEYPRKKCVHELYTEQAQKTPDAIALVFEEQKFTYKELDEMSNSLAHYLRNKGVKPNDVVPIIAKRSWHVIVAMLAVLKAGGAYMPVEPSYPVDRIEYMLEETKANTILTYDWKKQLGDYNVISLEQVDYYHNTNMLVNVNTAFDLAYVLFTSGSTGKPKATLISHTNLGNFVNNNNKNDHQSNVIRSCKIVLADTIFTFDISVFEIYMSVLNGLTVILTKEMADAKYISNLIEQYEVDVIHTTPTKILLLLQSVDFQRAVAGVKMLMIGAELFTEELYLTIRKYTNAVIYNGYGPTETTIGCSFKRVEKRTIENDGKYGESVIDITIGSPIANTQIYILDKHNHPLPIGVAGELCIAGDGVGKGYLNRPELTAEKFVPNLFADDTNHHGKVMYHTGDLARWRADGEIEYLGRMDTQVKIRGLRIELGEIESVMSGFAGVGLTAVADKRDANNRQYLVGYYTVEDADGQGSFVDEKQLRQHLAEKLPKYMVPNYFMKLDKMPMTPSGKTDRKNLPVPDFSVQKQEYIKPETKTEQKLAEIWKSLLHTDKIGKTDDFFELGGDSLLAITMLNEIEDTFRVNVSVQDIMENSSMEQLAICIDKAQAVVPITRQNDSRYRLLPQQEAIYAVYSKNPSTLAYNMPARIPLSKNIDREKLKVCMSQVFGAHRLLKSYFQTEDAKLYGIYDEKAQIVFEQYENGREKDFIRPFDLSKAPLVRVGFTEDSMLIDMHHIVADGESMNIILRDILSVYKGLALENKSIEYSDYSRYFYELDTTAHQDYFKTMLTCDFEPVMLPETKQPKQGGKSKIYEMPKEVFAETQTFARHCGLTDTMVFLAAYGILLSKYSANTDILSSVILRNRIHADAKNTVGMFVNTLPIYLRADGNTKAYLGDVKDRLLNLLRYQELSFWDIANAVGMRDKSVVNTSFVYQGDGEKILDLDGEKLIPQIYDTNTAKFDLSMELTPVESGCRIRLEYNCEKYDEMLMDKLEEAYIDILKQLGKEELSDISVLSQEEYQKVVYDFNDTYVEYPRKKCVHELYTEQAQKTPDAIALVFEEQKFTYKELDEMSNSLAHYLRNKGVKPNDVVPIIAKRSWHVIVAMLAVLKAGGAYLLIDYQYPHERIQYLVEESKASCVLTYGARYVESIDLESCCNIKNEVALNCVNNIDDVYTVIHTSGSTGKPKVTSLTHRNIVHYIACSEKLFEGINQVIATTVITFDAFIQETLVPLCKGIPVILFGEDEMTKQEEYEKRILDYKNSFMFQTPTKLLSYIRNSKDSSFLKAIKCFVLGGEVFPQELYDMITNSNQDCTIYNIYGPTETTVCSNTKKVESAIDITIGSPIANTQIYILDKHNHPLPIGVAGELCIAGDGVGKGYLNRPELTAEKFVPNLFADDTNHHGKVMYHTGDLARWRADGEIEYLGRMDTQVKIRGLRIELGEIESVMSGFAGVGLTAVADKRDENNRQYLVGYYTVEDADGQGSFVDEKQLRQHLAEKLPKYMVPNYFMKLDKMPMTPSGKTDRKNLPVPDFSLIEQEYVAPQSEQEALLCHLLEEILHMERVGVEDDFFEYGGDSLAAIEYVARAHEKGVDIALQNIFDYPTVRGLCAFLGSGAKERVQYEFDDFNKYEKLLAENVVDESFEPCRRSLGNVLLTGATGFLGAHVLDRFMSAESGKVYCLIRSNAEDDRRGRLYEMLEYYFGKKYEADYGKRIIPIVGDMEMDGLSEQMPDDVQTVIHTAASVKHYGSYDYFHKVNVEGTQHVIDYAKSVGAKLIHVSTLSVSGNSMADEFAVYRSNEEMHFYETSLYIGQPLDNVYIHSKFEAEKRVYDAMLDGLDAKVIRVGNLTNRTGDYKFQPNYKENAFLTRVKAILEFGMFPAYLMHLYSEFSPVDLTAEGIIRIAEYAKRQTVFHLNSNRPIYFDRFLEVVHTMGIPMQVVDGVTFNLALQKTIKNTGTEYIFEAFQNDMDEKGQLVYDSNIRIENEFTLWFLKKVGFEWNETDVDYIRGYIAYFRKIGYLEV